MSGVVIIVAIGVVGLIVDLLSVDDRKKPGRN